MAPSETEETAGTLGAFAKGVLITATSLILGWVGFSCWFSDMRGVPPVVQAVVIWGSFLAGGFLVGALAGGKRWWLSILPSWGLLSFGLVMGAVGDRHVLAEGAMSALLCLVAGYVGAKLADRIRERRAQIR